MGKMGTPFKGHTCPHCLGRGWPGGTGTVDMLASTTMFCHFSPQIQRCNFLYYTDINHATAMIYFPLILKLDFSFFLTSPYFSILACNYTRGSIDHGDAPFPYRCCFEKDQIEGICFCLLASLK